MEPSRSHQYHSRSNSLPCLFVETTGRMLQLPVDPNLQSDYANCYYPHYYPQYNAYGMPEGPGSIQMRNLPERPSNPGQTGGRQKFQRTFSYDASQFRHGANVPTDISDSTANYWRSAEANRSLRVAGGIYGPGANGYQQSQLYGTKEEFYKPRPVANYNANSYMGASSLALNSLSYPQPNNLYSQGQMNPPRYEMQSAWPGHYRSMSHLPPSDLQFPLPNPPSLMMDRSPVGSIDTNSLPNGSSAKRTNRAKFLFVLCILVIIIAVLVAMGIAVYSQVRTQGSALNLIRQYRGVFALTDVPDSELDEQLLNVKSSTFHRKGKQLEDQIDNVLKGSPIATVFEGSEVTSFRFVATSLSLEVQFILKVKVNAVVPVQDLLALLEEGLRGSEKGDFKIDPNSLQIEGEKLQKHQY